MTAVAECTGQWRCDCFHHRVDRARWKQVWMIDRRAGVKRLVPAPCDIVLRFLDDGYSAGAVAAAAGCQIATIERMAASNSRSTSSDMARRIQGLSHEQILSTVRGRVLVPAVGAVRRLQALARIGWSCSELALQVGQETLMWRLRDVLAGKTQSITADTHREIRRLYDRFSVTPSGGVSAGRMRRRAEALGWPPPLAWDDDIDDPAGQPWTGGDVELVAAVFVEDVAFLLTAGCNAEEVCRRMGAVHRRDGAPFQLAAMAQRLRRYGRIDLARPFNAAQAVVRDAQEAVPI